MGALIPEVIPTLSLPEFYKVSTEEGHEPEMILTTPALNAQFDRGGQRLLYEDDKSYENLVYVVSIEYGDTKRITNTPDQERNVSFSYDGRKLVFAAEHDKSWNSAATACIVLGLSARAERKCPDNQALLKLVDLQ